MKASAWSTGQRVVGAAVGAHPLLEHLLERGAADVLHDDVAGTLVGHEVVDLDDQRVLDLGEELLLGDGRGQRVGVAGVEQALEHDPAVGDVAVAGQVDPAEAAVGEGADDLVLPADEVAGLQLGREGELLAALGAEALGAPGPAVAAAADRRCRTWSRCACPRAPAGRGGSPCSGRSAAPAGRWSGRRRCGRRAAAASRCAGGWVASESPPTRAEPKRAEPTRADDVAVERGVGARGGVAGGRGRAGGARPPRTRRPCRRCRSSRRRWWPEQPGWVQAAPSAAGAAAGGGRSRGRRPRCAARRARRPCRTRRSSRR